MALICIKIGENEPDTYGKYYQLSRHLDIVDVIKDKASPGVMAEKEFFVLNVDLSGLTAEQFKAFKLMCKQPIQELLGYVQDVELGEQHPLYHTTVKRKHKLNMTAVDWLSLPTKTVIEEKAEEKRAIKANLYQYQADNGLTTTSDKIMLITNLKKEYDRRVKITGTGDLVVSNVASMTDEGKTIIIDRITRQHLAIKKDEFSAGFDMRTVNKLDQVVPYETFMASITDKEK